MTEWQPIDTAQREEKDILVTDCENITIGSYVKYKDKFFPYHLDGANNSWWKVTHWMPLPEVPPNKHYCKDECNTWECFTNLRGKLSFGLVNRDKIEPYFHAKEVNYCPFCGETADENESKECCLNDYVKCVHCGKRTNVKRYLYSEDLKKLEASFFFCYECDKSAEKADEH